MTDKQPEALRLADWLESEDMPTDIASCADAADELRRLHALNQEWEAKAATWLASPEAQKRLAGYRELAAQRDAAEMMSLALKAQRDELLEALRGYVNDFSSEDGMYDVKHYVKVFSEVIARAERKQ